MGINILFALSNPCSTPLNTIPDFKGAICNHQEFVKQELIGIGSPIHPKRKQEIIKTPSNDHRVVKNNTKHHEYDLPPAQPLPSTVKPGKTCRSRTSHLVPYAKLQDNERDADNQKRQYVRNEKGAPTVLVAEIGPSPFPPTKKFAH